MPDYEKMKPGTDILAEGANTVASDRAKRINSLHQTVDNLVQEENKKRLQVSNEISSLTKQQQKMIHQLELERGDLTAETAQGYNTVLKGLGETIKSLSTGIKNITSDTARATSDAVSQYGKAIGEDININKTNTIAMALSRATPLFGYFAAKFMETDVFQDASRKIKNRIGGAVSEGLKKTGSTVADVFKRGKDITTEERENATVSELQDIKKRLDKEPPKLQEGGFIKQGGLVEVHAAEVVAPIDKILEQIDQAKSADISKKLDATMRMMSERMAGIETIVVEREKSQKGIIRTFIEEFQKARDQKQESYQRRQLKAILELKVAMIGMTSRLRISWQRTLLQHPAFRNMLLFSEVLRGAIVTPLKVLFGIRGGYASDVRGATSTHNSFLKISNLLGILYSTGMPKLDEISKYTKITAESLTGKAVDAPTQERYTLFQKIRESLTSRPIVSLQKRMFEGMVDKLGLDKKSLEEAGISGFGGLARPKRILRKMGATRENIVGSFGEKPPEWADDMVSDITKLRKMKETQEDREKGHSPSMADNISYGADLARKEAKRQRSKDEKQLGFLGDIKKNAREQTSFLKRMNTRLRKLSGKVMDWVMLGLGALQNFVSNSFGVIGNTLGSILGGFGLGKLFKKGKLGKLGSAPKQMSLFTKAGKATKAAQVGRVGMGARVAGVGGKVAGIGAKVAGAAVGAITGAVMSISDSIYALRNPEEFAANRLAAGVGAALAGKDSGWEGTKRGVLKGSAFGMAIGSFIPGIGTAIGGAFGALAGGILGFVGGKNISVGLAETAEHIKGISKAISSFVFFPFKLLKEGLKSADVLMDFAGSWIDDWLQKPGWIQSIINFVRDKIMWVVDKVKESFYWWKDKLATFFEKDIWKTLKQLATDVLMTVMFPLNGIAKIFKWLGTEIDTKLKALPYVGKIYSLAMKAIKGISEGTLASELEKSLSEYAPKSAAEKAKAAEGKYKSDKESLKAHLGKNIVYKGGELKQIKEDGKWRILKAKESEEIIRGWKEKTAKDAATKGKPEPKPLPTPKPVSASVEKAATSKTVRRPMSSWERSKLEMKEKRNIMRALGASNIVYSMGELDRLKVGGIWRKATDHDKSIASQSSLLTKLQAHSKTRNALPIVKLPSKPKEAEEKMKGWKDKIIKDKAAEVGAANQSAQKETDKILAGMKESTSKNEATTIASTKMIVATNISTTNSQVGGGGGGAVGAAPFSNAYGVASDVARCNLS